MTRRRLVILLSGIVLVTGLSVLFVFPLREVLRNAFIEPLIEGWHLARWYVLRLSQTVLWVVLVLVGGGFLVRAFLRSLGEPSRSEEPPPVHTPKGSEFEQLSVLVARSRHRPFSRRRLAEQLVGLCVRLIAGREGLSLSAARTRFEEFAWCDEPAVADFFAYRRHYHGLGRGADFEEKLRKTISFLERYQEGNRWN